MNDRIEKTIEFLKKVFDQSDYFKANPSSKEYRLEHSFRVCNIGKKIAEAENMNVEAMMIACLLHDVSYGEDFKCEDDWLNHGRRAAEISRPFLESLSLDAKCIDEICFGIAIHVDDEADFKGEKNAFTLTIGEADNIDRFDVYRIYESLQYTKFDKLSLPEKSEKVSATLEKLMKLKTIKIATTTGKNLWLDRIDFYIQFYLRLQDQLNNSYII